MIEYLRIAITSATLLYSSYLDLRTREVDDKVWILPSIVGAALNLYAYITSDPSALIMYGVGVGATAGVAFALYLAGLYGGADAKALTCIAAVHPTTGFGVQLHGITGLTTFTNGMILSASLPISLAIYNLSRIARGERIFRGFESEPWYRRVSACFIGTRVYNSAGRKFWSPVEKRVDGLRKFVFNISIDDMAEAEYDDMWITPGIPLLIFFTGGYFLALAIGDLMAVFFTLQGWRAG
jgi:preflagellin peptidase FlaK